VRSSAETKKHGIVLIMCLAENGRGAEGVNHDRESIVFSSGFRDRVAYALTVRAIGRGRLAPNLDQPRDTSECLARTPGAASPVATTILKLA
jgi:hypothetical protein